VIVGRDRTGLFAFRGLDNLWHSDWKDATTGDRVSVSASCGKVPSLHLPEMKRAEAVPPYALCPSCWDVTLR